MPGMGPGLFLRRGDIHVLLRQSETIDGFKASTHVDWLIVDSQSDAILQFFESDIVFSLTAGCKIVPHQIGIEMLRPASFPGLRRQEVR